jgi:REP element-mobilizing transposase RayT
MRRRDKKFVSETAPPADRAFAGSAESFHFSHQKPVPRSHAQPATEVAGELALTPNTSPRNRSLIYSETHDPQEPPMPETLAVLLTWTTYGTWLHGDDRGSSDRKQSKPLAPDPVREAHARGMMKFPALTLDARMRRVAREAIEEHCRFRGWELRALNVRTNHVHVVITGGERGQKVIGLLKSRVTRMLRYAGLVKADQPVWTAEGGNVRALHHPEAVSTACHYVRNQQGAPLPEE